MGGIVEFAEIVPALFVAVTVMLIALTRLEQNLGRDRSPSRVAAPARDAARRWCRPRHLVMSPPVGDQPDAGA